MVEIVRGLVDAAPPEEFTDAALDETFSPDELSPNTRFAVKAVSKKGYAALSALQRLCSKDSQLKKKVPNIRITDFELLRKLVRPFAKSGRGGLDRSNIVSCLETLVK